MIPRKLTFLVLVSLTVFSLAVGVFAQTHPDLDGLHNETDGCSPESHGCRVPRLTPTPSPNHPAADRDGDGVADFVDLCPDEAGTGFTEGCPNEQPSAEATPARQGILWAAYDRCLVANPGPGNVNIRALVPTAANPRPEVVGSLSPGEQFEPLYRAFDASNTAWYGNAAGWVSGAAVSTNGACANLPQPTAERASADRGICLLIVPRGEGARAFRQTTLEAEEIAQLDPGTVVVASERTIDAAGVAWYRSFEAWIRGVDVRLQGDCDFILPSLPPLDDDVDPVTDECILMTPLGSDGVGLYSAMVHDVTFLLATLHGGLAFQAEYAGSDLEGHVWYNIGGWIDSDQVVTTGDCAHLPIPPIAPQLACQVLIPGWNPAVNMYREPVVDPAGLVYPIPAGMVRTALARTWDANNDLWYFLNYGEGGWSQRSQVIPLNPAACDSLPATAPPVDPNTCVITAPAGGGTPVYLTPLQDPAQLINVLNPGTNVLVDDTTTVNGSVWFYLDSWGGWVSSHQVVASGNCANLPSYHATDDICRLAIPADSPGVNIMDSYDSATPTTLITIYPVYWFTPTLAAHDSGGIRWYYVSYTENYSGWVNSQTVIETAPETCSQLMPSIQLDISLFEGLQIRGLSRSG